MLYLVVAVGVYGTWVYQIDRNVRLGVCYQSSGRIHVERSTDDDEDIGLLHSLGSRLYHRNILAEEDDEWSQQAAIASLGSRLHLTVILRQLLDVSIVVRVARRADLGEFSMQVDHVLGSRLLVQVIHILCNHRYVEILLQILDKFMSLVRLSGIELMAQHIIEVSY